jgi:hypothetical protein
MDSRMMKRMLPFRRAGAPDPAGIFSFPACGGTKGGSHCRAPLRIDFVCRAGVPNPARIRPLLLPPFYEGGIVGGRLFAATPLRESRLSYSRDAFYTRHNGITLPARGRRAVREPRRSSAGTARRRHRQSRGGHTRAKAEASSAAGTSPLSTPAPCSRG